MTIKATLQPFTKCSIAVLYLARKAEGMESFQPFIDSYLSHSAGIEHDVVVILKGYDHAESLEDVRTVFSKISSDFIVLPDEGYDLDSYLQAAGTINHEYICCCNTFSTIRAVDWMEKLYMHVSGQDVGIVGATGSYESNRDSLIYFQKIVWRRLHSRFNRKQEQAFRKYCDFVLDYMCPPPPEDYKGQRGDRGLFGSFRSLMDNWFYRTFREEREYENWWSEFSISIKDFRELCEFPPFPNPHVRTNAFMMSRSRYVSLVREASGCKLDTSLIESGAQSITRQIVGSGLKAKIVGKNGIAYDIPEWPQSGTFRLGNQENLIIADNRTRDFDNSSDGWRLTHSWLSWGRPAIRLPSDFPHLNIDLKSVVDVKLF